MKLLQRSTMTRYKRLTIVTIVFSLITITGNGQNYGKTLLNDWQHPDDEVRLLKGARIAFYNVENLFYPYDDSLKLDEEFTPSGFRHWTWEKMETKIDHIYKTFNAFGGWELPAIIGLCEVENRKVLNRLIYETPLSRFNYRIVHEESPDFRGIDVALLYNPMKFEPAYHRAIEVRFPFDTTSRTRDILYIKGPLLNRDTLHLFVNHWPSRYGGYAATKPKRNETARILRQNVDSLFLAIQAPHIIIMGDFNDDPDDESLADVLNAQPVSPLIQAETLYNLMQNAYHSQYGGTLKHQAQWNQFDQIIVSGSLLDTTGILSVENNNAYIFDAPYLLEPDEKFMGRKPFRTYSGPRYLGGFSDHLPVFIDVMLNEKDARE